MIEAGDDFLLRFFIAVFFGDQTDFYGAIDDIGKQFQREFVFVELEDVSRTANFFAIAFRNFLRPKPELRLSVFVRADRNVAVNFGDVRNRPASFERGSRRKYIFEPVSRKSRKLIVGKRVDVIVGDRIGRNAVALKQSTESGVVQDHRFVSAFSRFLRKRVSVSEIGNMAENGRRNVVQKTRERLRLVVRKVPQDERDADTVIEPGIIKSVPIERRPIGAAQKPDARQPLQNRKAGILINKFGKIGRKDTVIGGDRKRRAFRKGRDHERPRHAVESIFSHSAIVARFCA